MTILRTAAGTTKCPECRGTCDPTGWIPSPGQDPMMRQFRCRSHRHTFFYVLPTGEALMNIKERVKALRGDGTLIEVSPTA